MGAITDDQASIFLLDTHTLLWWLFNDSRLSITAFEIIQNPEHTILVSSASGEEIASKYRLGKLPHAGEAVTNLPTLQQKARMELLPLTMEHSLAGGALPGPHHDPCERMLIAQSRIEGCPLITTDSAFKQYPVTLIW